MSNPSNPLKTASVLAFERKLDPSDAVFYAGCWDERDTAASWLAVPVRTELVRGTISNRLKTKDQDPAKLDAVIENPNLQAVDVAVLPHDLDTLKVQFTLRVLSGTGTPSACNNTEYQAKLAQTIQNYVATHSFTPLAQRYAANLANGRFLWRNRVGAENIEIVINQLKNGSAEKTWKFDALAYSLRSFNTVHEDMQSLAALIADGLAGKAHVLLKVTAFVRMGAGQEVFPSQELILDKGSVPKSKNPSQGHEQETLPSQELTFDKGSVKKSKTLYQVGTKGQEIAAIHSRKIGNALRTIDNWYEDAETFGPIAVEPYGSVTTQGKAYRQPKQKQDFYTLLDHWLIKDKVPTVEQQHFVIAVLIRGGVFGDAS